HHHEHDGEGHGHEHCHHDHDGHHHADEIFTSWGIETPLSYTQSEIEERLQKLEREEEYGIVLRAKGMVPSGDCAWIYFDYVPEECDIRSGKPDVTGKICVIGSKLDEEKLAALFHK
ncbi:MAG: GTP-binding protein, partial [Lachnospiraceae bacterium]|nr:GTP-binding protein [Lachnospiraceae bacterium]